MSTCGKRDHLTWTENGKKSTASELPSVASNALLKLFVNAYEKSSGSTVRSWRTSNAYARDNDWRHVQADRSGLRGQQQVSIAKVLEASGLVACWSSPK
jgi:hypothetical protein